MSISTLRFDEGSEDDALDDSYYSVAMDNAMLNDRVLAISQVKHSVNLFRKNRITEAHLQERVDILKEAVPSLRKLLEQLPAKKDDEYLERLTGILIAKRKELDPEYRRANAAFNRLYRP